MSTTADSWGDRRLVVIAGAGVSALAPSDLPDWWQFNQAVLDGIRKRAFQVCDFDAPTIAALEQVTLDSIDVTLFSQVVTSAFAGSGWFDLVARLDGSVPSPCHDAFARLAGQGQLAAIVTTNFDTLFERAFEDAGIPLDIVIVTPDYRPTGLTGTTCRLIKVHGSVSATNSLVDLASQKARGIPPLVRAWLSRLFAEHPLLVAGFSGRDLDFGEDYLGLLAATPHNRWLRWVTPDARRALPTVAELVKTSIDGAFVEGLLPGVLDAVGMDVPAPRSDSHSTGAVDVWVSEWLGDALSSPERTAAGCARLLRFANSEEAAHSLRQTVRTSINDRLRGTMPAVDVLNCSSALAIVGVDEVGTDNAQAEVDLNKSAALRELAVSTLDGTTYSAAARRAQADEMVSILLNTAIAAVGVSELARAADLLKTIRRTVEGGSVEGGSVEGGSVEGASPTANQYARAATFLVSGLISRLEDNPRRALISWRTAISLALEIGATEVAYLALENRWRAAWDVNEYELARILAEESDAVARILPGRRPGATQHLNRQPRVDLNVAFAADRLRQEIGKKGERLDEVLILVWDVLGQDGNAAAELIRKTLDSIDPQVFLQMPPLARALAAFARYIPSAQDNGVPQNEIANYLLDAMTAFMASGVIPTIIEARVPSYLRGVIRTFAAAWANAGVTGHADGKWDLSSNFFTVGGIAFGLAGDREQATQAFLYLTDSWRRLGSFAESAKLLELIEPMAPPALTSAVVARRCRVLADRVAATEVQIDDAMGELDSLVLHLRELGSDTDLGMGLVSAAKIVAIQDVSRALEMAMEARVLVGTDHLAEVEKLINLLRIDFE